jgi:hypothetical protein
MDILAKNLEKMKGNTSPKDKNKKECKNIPLNIVTDSPNPSASSSIYPILVEEHKLSGRDNEIHSLLSIILGEIKHLHTKVDRLEELIKTRGQNVPSNPSSFVRPAFQSTSQGASSSSADDI